MFIYQVLKWTSSSSNDDKGERQQQLKAETSDNSIEEFASACTYLPIALNEGRIVREDQLYFYSRYKRVTCGKADPSKRPGIFDIVAREKFDAWAALSSMSTEEAMRQYVARLRGLNLGWDPAIKYSIRCGARPSTLMDADSSEAESSDLSADQLQWFAALEEDNMEKLRNLLIGNASLLEARDENQATDFTFPLNYRYHLTALHWASDRGKLELVDFLTSAGTNVNIQDYSGQTPLHYAVSCSHRSIVNFLLEKGADPTIADFEGNCPLDLVSDTAIRRMLENVISEMETKT